MHFGRHGIGTQLMNWVKIRGSRIDHDALLLDPARRPSSASTSDLGERAEGPPGRSGG